MTVSDDSDSRSALDAALDIHRVRQYFNVIVGARDIAVAARKDARFLHVLRLAMLPLPFDGAPGTGQVFEPAQDPVPPPLAGRVGVVATGGSGAMACLFAATSSRSSTAATSAA
jgi:NTE family protein